MGDKERTVNILIKAKNDASKSLESVLKSLTSVQGIAIEVAAGAAYMALAFTKVTQAAMEQEKADVRLAAALASIGQNTAANREHPNKFVAQLEDLTGVSDEAISASVALLAQLGQLSGQGLEDATVAALDLAAALGMDLQSAATLVAKAAQGNTAALTRYGIVLNQSIPTTERGAAALKLLHDRFGGAAEAAGTTFSTALARVANQFDNLEQAIGKAVVENDAFRALLDVVNKLLIQAQGFVEGNTAAFQGLVTMAARAAIAMIKFGLEVVNAEARIADMNLSFLQFLATLATLASVAPALFEKVFGVGGDEARLLAQWGGKSIAALQRMKGVAADVAGASAAGIKTVEEALAHLSDSTGPKLDNFKNHVDVVTEAVSNLTEAAGPAAPGLLGLDAILDTLGMQTLPAMANNQRVFNLLIDELAEKFEGENGLPEEFRSIFESSVDIAETLPDWTTNLSAAAQHASEVRDRLAELQDVITDQLTNSALQFSDALIDGAFGAKIAWGQFFKQMLADLLKAIARMLILDAIAAALTGGGSAAAGAATGGGSGGVLHGFSGLGGALDSFQPAQGMLPSFGAAPGVTLSAAGFNTEPGSGPGQSAALQMFNQIVPVRDREAEVADLISDISRAVERRGFHLVASRVLA